MSQQRRPQRARQAVTRYTDVEALKATPRASAAKPAGESAKKTQAQREWMDAAKKFAKERLVTDYAAQVLTTDKERNEWLVEKAKNQNCTQFVYILIFRHALPKPQATALERVLSPMPYSPRRSNVSWRCCSGNPTDPSLLQVSRITDFNNI